MSGWRRKSKRVPIASWKAANPRIPMKLLQLKMIQTNDCSVPILPSQCGITVEPIYYGEVFTNARGGLSTNGATKYNGSA